MTACDICGSEAPFTVWVMTNDGDKSKGIGIPACKLHVIQACDRSHLLALDIISENEVKEPKKGAQGAISMKALTGKK